jgi:methylmalonyl-CoA/ethylmalonyl-CoA epimerase
MAKITKINHIGIVVGDMDTSLAFWKEAMGISLNRLEDVPSEQVAIAFMPVGESEVELVKPTTEESGVAKFLADKNGVGGMHHLCFEVDDIEEMMAQLKEKGVRLLADAPKELPGRKMVFVHPKSTGGVLVELYQTINK